MLDAVNAIIYAMEGDIDMAIISLICTIPIVGSLIGLPIKYAMRYGVDVGTAFMKFGIRNAPEITEGVSRLARAMKSKYDDASAWISKKFAKVTPDVGRISKGGKVPNSVWDYSKQFDGELSSFNSGYQINTTIDKDLYLVQFHSSAELGKGRSLKYWTTFDEANNISTIDDYMDKMALLSNWGARDNITIARIPAGTNVRYAIGTARAQTSAIESRPGGGIQLLFEYFDENWIIDTRSLN